jgi:pimeloyl-ACP methyl ester carboxylesterase
MNADIWGEAPNDLARQHKVVVYDRRGYSRSIAHPVKNYHTHGEDAAALLSGLDLAPATVVGWSAGGIVALDLAINHPELVSSMVLYEPPLHAKKHPDFGMIRTLIKVTVQRHTQGAQRAAQTFLRYALSARTGESAWDQWPESWRQIMSNNASSTLAELDAGTGEELTEAQITAIHCPITCLWGDQSQPLLRNATKRLLRLLPQALSIEVAGGAHGLHVSHRSKFVQAVEQAVTDGTRVRV